MRKTNVVAALLLLSGAALAQQQPDPQARFQEALRLEEGKGDAEGAAQAFEALARDPTTPQGLRGRAWLRAGACWEKAGQPLRAIQAYNAADGLLDAAGKAEASAGGERAGRALNRHESAKSGIDAIQVEAGPAGPLLSLALTDANVRTTLHAIARRAGLSLVIAPEVQGRVTLVLAKVGVREALRTIVETVGDYTLVTDVSGAILRVISRSSDEQQVDVWAYPLVERPAGPETRKTRLELLANVELLLLRSNINGVGVSYEPARQVLFVQASPAQRPAVELLLQGLVRERPAAPAEGVLVDAEHEDADVRAVLSELARKAGRPLLISAEVRGRVTLHARQVPYRDLLEAVAATAGDYDVAGTPAADIALSRSSTEQWLRLTTWPLAVEPARFWRAGEWLLPLEGRPVHFLERALLDRVLRSNINGATIQLDPVSNRLITQLTPPLEARLVRALVVAGYLARPAERTEGTLATASEGTNIRAALSNLASQRNQNLVISPEVQGEVAGSWWADASPLEVADALARACGDFAVIEDEGGVLRVISRSSAEVNLVTKRFPLANRPARGAPLLIDALSNVVLRSNVNGALVLHQVEGNFVVASLPRPLLAEVGEVVSACDAVVVPAAGIDVAAGKVNKMGAKGPDSHAFRLDPNGFDERPAANHLGGSGEAVLQLEPQGELRAHPWWK